MSMSNGSKITLTPRNLTSADLPDPFGDIDLQSEEGYEAPDPTMVKFQLSLDIGPAGSVEADLFECIVVTKKIESKVQGNIKKIVLNTYTHHNLKRRLLAVIAECEAETWYSCLKNLRRCFSWEYEGMYTEDDIRRLND